MATITPTVTHLNANALLVTWTAITHADEGGPVQIDPKYADKTFSIEGGTFTGSATYALEGSMLGTTFIAMHSAGGSVASGSAISLAADGSAVVAQNMRHYQVNRGSGSAGATVIARLLCVCGGNR